jgi:protein-tyrosine phosphatase
LLWRSDDVTIAPSIQLAALAAAGLKAIIDLRSSHELKATGRMPAEQFGIEHHHLPLTSHDGSPAALAGLLATVDTAEEMGRWYARLFRAQAKQLVSALQIIAATNGGVLFHCAAGKDRTGLLAAAVLGLLGAKSETIVADYALTQGNIHAVMARLATHEMRAAGGNSALSPALGNHPLRNSPPKAMAVMLAELDKDGGITTILRKAGYDTALELHLQAKLIEH